MEIWGGSGRRTDVFPRTGSPEEQLRDFTVVFLPTGGTSLSLSLPPSYSSFFSFSCIIHLLLLHPLTRLSFPQFAEKLDFSRINIPENSDSVQKQIKLFTLGRIISINNHLQM